jgi:lysyl-tRNA synthetase class 1
LEIVKILPEKNQLSFTLKKLKELGHVKTITPGLKADVEKRLFYAKNWFEKFGKKEIVEVEVTDKERKAIRSLIEAIEAEKDGEKLQNKIFQIAETHGIKPSKFFKLIYQILLKSKRGPRLGPYIIDSGKEEVIKKLKKVV